MYIIFKPTLRCNLNCLYCYEQFTPHKSEMTSSEMIQAIDFALEYCKIAEDDRVVFCWHGGELFTISVAKLAEVMKYAEEKASSLGIKIRQIAQTNLTLVNEETVDLIRRYLNGGIGVSVDIGTKCRNTRSGIDAEPVIKERLDFLLKNNIRCGAISLLTRRNIDKIEEIYTFFQCRRMNVRLSRVFPTTKEFDCADEMYLSDEEFAAAKIKYFDLWVSDKGHWADKEIIRILGDMLSGKPYMCCRTGKCFTKHLSISPGGTLNPCPHYDSSGHIIGNFLESTPREVFKSANLFSAKIPPLPQKCKQCRFFRICHGDCTSHRINIGYEYECRSNILYWTHLEKWLKTQGLSLYKFENKTSVELRNVMEAMIHG